MSDTSTLDGIRYVFHFHRGARLDERDLVRQTRALYDAAFDDTLPGAKRPPPEWSPVISLEHETIAGAPALTILHRLKAQPTREEIMGHTLITLPEGVFHARWSVAPDRITGVREARLLEEHFKKAAASAPIPSSAHFDDPIHDERFPDLALSRARRAKSWHTRAMIEISQNAVSSPNVTNVERCELLRYSAAIQSSESAPFTTRTSSTMPLNT